MLNSYIMSTKLWHQLKFEGLGQPKRGVGWVIKIFRKLIKNPTSCRKSTVRKIKHLGFFGGLTTLPMSTPHAPLTSLETFHY